jgi:hypothetical protein
VGLALKRSCSVHVLEKDRVLFRRLKSAGYRYLHPELRDSAFAADPSRGQSDLPFLNWPADYAPMVAAYVEAKFSAYCEQLPIFVSLGCEVTGVSESSSVILQLADGTEIVADVVIIASGFGNEHSLPGLPDSSYWYSGAPNSYKSRYRAAGKPERVAIAGNGDSGLIELFSYAIQDFRQEEMSRFFSSRHLSDSIILDVREATFTQIQNSEVIPSVDGPLPWYLGVHDKQKSDHSFLRNAHARRIHNAIERLLKREKICIDELDSKAFKILNSKIERHISADLDFLASNELAKIFASNSRLWRKMNPSSHRELKRRINKSFDIVIFGKSPSVFNQRQSQRNQLLLALLDERRAFRYVSRELNLEKECKFNNGLYRMANETFERVVVRLGTNLSSFESNFKPSQLEKYGHRGFFAPRELALERRMYTPFVPDIVRGFVVSSRRARKIFDAVEGKS